MWILYVLSSLLINHMKRDFVSRVSINKFMYLLNIRSKMGSENKTGGLAGMVL